MIKYFNEKNKKMFIGGIHNLTKVCYESQGIAGGDAGAGLAVLAFVIAVINNCMYLHVPDHIPVYRQH